jgi:archaetidylinositol phosphate synthase
VIPWDIRLARAVARPLRHTPLTPNALTTLGLCSSLIAAWLMASGESLRVALGGGFFMLGVFVDHLDGEFARLTGLTSRFGHYYDHVAAGLGYVSLFTGLGIGLRAGWLGPWGPRAGALAAGSIAAIFLMRVFLEETAGKAMVAQGNWRGFEPEDTLYLVGPVTWLGLQAPFLVAAAVGTPVFLLWVVWCAVARRSATSLTAAGSPARRLTCAGSRPRLGRPDGDPLTVAEARTEGHGEREGR